ncbi:MAG: hypothetical protein O7G85_05885, partial [Planctomycetota bacterium]|nr:hypothetical protein [Planctomycetota bacterium]
ADLDPDFQERCLPILKAAAEKGEVRPGDVAYLEDRVRVAQKRPQLYGTQYGVRHDADGNSMKDASGAMIYLLPVVEDAAGLDERRAAVGLGPWFEYETMMANMQNREPSKTPTDWDDTLPIDPQRKR